MATLGMFRLTSLGIIFLVGASVAPGCDTEEVPVERRMCERFDGCNYFSAGLDVDDCTDVMTMCTESLVRSRRDDWIADAEDALGRSNCGNFLETYQQATACTISAAGEVSESGNGSGGSGPAPSGSDSGSEPGSNSGSDPEPEGSCDEDEFACADDNTIEGCLDGEAFSFDCATVCGEDPTDGCAFDAESGHDVCFCVVDDPPEDPPEEPPGPAPEPGE